MSNLRVSFTATAIVTFLLAAQAYSQNERPAPKQAPAQQVRVVEVKYADPVELADVLLPFTRTNLAYVVPSKGLRTLTLSGRPEIVTAMEEIIRKLDVPHPQPQPKTIEVTAYLLAASETGNPALDLPAPLDPVVKQLRSTFAYKSYQLLDTIIGRSSSLPSSGGYRTEGFIPNPASPDTNVPYVFAYEFSRVNHSAEGDSVHLEYLRFALQYKTKKVVNNVIVDGSDDRGFQTNLDVRPGQMVVVGKTNFEVGRSALIAVISAKVID